MKRLSTLIIGALAPLTLTFCTSLAYAGDGYIGIYADAAGTLPCTTVPPLSGTTLYVIAKLEGASAGGISGAEFRIEVGNPSGWSLSYTPPSADVIMGNALDLNPQDPDDGSGVNIAFGACRQPVDGMVAMGTILVANFSGGPNELLVKRHSRPTNPGYECALFTLCDEPVYTKRCMTPTLADSCYLPVQKVTLSAAGDPVVFSTGINQPELPGAAFTRTIDLGNSELWVMGEPIPGPQVTCLFDGSVLTVGGIPVPVSAAQIPQVTIPEAELMSAYSAVPAVQAQLAAGVPIRQAVAVYEAERKTLWDMALSAYRSRGATAARDVLVSSPMMERVEMNGDQIMMWMRGFGYPIWLDTKERGPQPSASAQARARVDNIEEALRVTTLEGVLVMVTQGGLARLGAGLRTAAKVQIEHVRRGGDLATLPAGPLHAEDRFLQEVAKATKAKGQQR